MMGGSTLHSDPTFADRYRLLTCCGQGRSWGASGAHDGLSDQREYALKIFHRVSPERILHAAERFLREVKASAAIDSPHAVQLYDYGIHDGTPFIAMELLVGETLAGRLRARHPALAVRD